MLRLRVVSDLHVSHAEEGDADLVPPAEGDADAVLAVLGDVASAVTQRGRLRALFRHWASRFRLVLFVPGNHEFYDARLVRGRSPCDAKTVPDLLAQLRADAAEVGVRVLADATEPAVVVGHVRLLGATLWSHVPAAFRVFVTNSINDYAAIARERTREVTGEAGLALGWRPPPPPTITVDDTNAWHAAHVAALRAQLAAPPPAGVTKTVVLTHHAPLVTNTSAPQYAGKPSNAAFATDLPELLARADVWAFGHTHWRCDFIDAASGCRLLSNPRGYGLDEVPDFDPSLALEL